jgi:hypothetical protein
MAEWILPKIDWTGNSGPLPSDLNRMEGNAQYLKDALANEITDRESAIEAEAAARVAADALKQNIPSTSEDMNFNNFPVGTTLLVLSENYVQRNYHCSAPMTKAGSATEYTFTYVAGQTAMLGTWYSRGCFQYADGENYPWLVMVQRVL